MASGNCHLHWKEASGFDDVEFMDFVAILNKNGQRFERIWKMELEMKNL